jgi:hypothetical protein
MSSFPIRPLQIWRSSLAESLSPIDGAFRFEILPSLMVPQTLQLLRELGSLNESYGTHIYAFIQGMRFARDEALYYWKSFDDAKGLFDFDILEMFSAIRELELHTDINLTFHRLSYLADVGAGPALPLLIGERVPISRGIAFEVEERGAVRQSFRTGDFVLTDKAKMAQQHYSTGVALLAAEDQISGLIDAAFLQFYMVGEVILGTFDQGKAVANGQSFFGSAFTDAMAKMVKHVLKARGRFFGHAHIRWKKGQHDADIGFEIAKQVLVARWCARELLSLEIKRPLVHREMRLYSRPNASVGFFGDPNSLDSEFKLPK